MQQTTTIPYLAVTENQLRKINRVMVYTDRILCSALYGRIKPAANSNSCELIMHQRNL
jgi:hypothetical protein